ncbi:MAG TPA: TetR/AcrR family transcriptional regulator [Anaeromyxobacteraceae bacterium]
MSAPSRLSDDLLVQRRRAQIVAAAVELFAGQGYHQTTVQDVARRAGVSAGLIYQYVADKDDLLLQALATVLDLYRQEIPRALRGLADPLERWRTAARAYCEVVDRHRESCVLAYRSTKSLRRDRRRVIKEAEMETNALIAGCVRDCIEAGLFRPVDVELATYQVVMLAHAWALKHWRMRDLWTLDEYLSRGLDLFAHALLTPRGWRRWRALPAPAPAPRAGATRPGARGRRRSGPAAAS